MAADFDVLIVGAGPVGAALAALLVAREGVPPTRVALAGLELRALAGDPLRVLALTRGTERVARTVGAWADLAAGGAAAYDHMRIWHESVGSDAALEFDAAESGEPNLGHIAPAHVLQNALLEAFVRQGGVVRQGALGAVSFAGDTVVATIDGAPLRAALIVGADGARSAVREALGWPANTGSYSQSAIVATVTTERAHQHTAWQRFVGGGTLALLPLSDRRVSIVWSVPRERAEALRALDVMSFNAALTVASDNVLGDLHVVGNRGAHPLLRLQSTQYVAERCVLIGDAAHVVHPLAGQGVNLGIGDADVLARCVGEAMREREDPGALRTLRSFERWRRGENELMSVSIDSFNRLLATGTDPLARMAQRGLGWVNHSRFLKKLFVERALQ